MSRRKHTPGRPFHSGCGARWLLLAIALAPLAGCSGTRWIVPGIEGPERSEQHDRRGEAMIREFEARRKAVQTDAAEAALARGDYRESERLVRSILDSDGSHRDARLLLAEVLLLTGRHPEAFTQLEHALRDHGEDPLVHYAMGLLLDASGRPDEARPFYERSAELNPDFKRYAFAHETLGNSDVSTVSNDPNAPAADAVSYLEPAVGEPLGEVRKTLAAGNLDAVQAGIQAALAADPDNPQIPVHAAVLALEHNHPQLAVDVLKPATTQFPEAAAVRRTLGAAYYRLGDYSSAQVALRQALSLDNSDGLSYLLMGCTLEKLGQPRAAHLQFERAAASSLRYRTMQR